MRIKLANRRVIKDGWIFDFHQLQTIQNALAQNKYGNTNLQLEDIDNLLHYLFGCCEIVAVEYGTAKGLIFGEPEVKP